MARDQAKYRGIPLTMVPMILHDDDVIDKDMYMTLKRMSSVSLLFRVRELLSVFGEEGRIAWEEYDLAHFNITIMFGSKKPQYKSIW